MTYVTNHLNSALVSQKQSQYAKYFSAFIAKGKNIIYGTYVVQRKREKSLGVEVKPFVMPPHRNAHTEARPLGRLMLLNRVMDCRD
jgi:hypothetical protein